MVREDLYWLLLHNQVVHFLEHLKHCVGLLLNGAPVELGTLECSTQESKGFMLLFLNGQLQLIKARLSDYS